jgi:hypothetical protein
VNCAGHDQRNGLAHRNGADEFRRDL